MPIPCTHLLLQPYFSKTKFFFLWPREVCMLDKKENTIWYIYYLHIHNMHIYIYIHIMHTHSPVFRGVPTPHSPPHEDLQLNRRRFWGAKAQCGSTQVARVSSIDRTWDQEKCREKMFHFTSLHFLGGSGAPSQIHEGDFFGGSPAAEWNWTYAKQIGDIILRIEISNQ